MKILAPLSSPGEVEPLARAGADEFYCGLVEEKWLEKDLEPEVLNKEPSMSSQLKSFDELALTCRRAAQHGIPVTLTMNSLYYTDCELDYLRDLLEKAVEAGVWAVVTADIGIMLHIREQSLPLEVIVSKVAGCANPEAAKFFRTLGARRFVVPEHISVAEIEALAAHCPGMELELFILNGGCKYEEAFCHWLHNPGCGASPESPLRSLLKKFYFDERLFRMLRTLPRGFREALENAYDLAFAQPSVCNMGSRVEEERAGAARRLPWSEVPSYFHSLFFAQTCLCALCHIPVFSRAGITTLKIMGRGYSTSKKARDVALVKSIIDLAERRNGEGWVSAVKAEYRRRCGFGCEESCYYVA